MVQKPLYYAYGSNMLSTRIGARFRRTPEFVATHRLSGYKLEFSGGRGCYANITPSNLITDFVDGVLYRITDDQTWLLDQYEGYPSAYQKFYFIKDGQICFGYWTQFDPLAQYRHDFGKPPLEYLNILIEGCLEHNFVHTFDRLMAYKTANYKLTRGNKFKMKKKHEEFR